MPAGQRGCEGRREGMDCEVRDASYPVVSVVTLVIGPVQLAVDVIPEEYEDQDPSPVEIECADLSDEHEAHASPSKRKHMPSEGRAKMREEGVQCDEATRAGR